MPTNKEAKKFFIRIIYLGKSRMILANFAGQDLSGRNFSDRNLKGANLSGTVLFNATLDRANFSPFVDPATGN